jgi:hypothetical protein
MQTTIQQTNKALVLEAFETLFNKTRLCSAAKGAVIVKVEKIKPSIDVLPCFA